MRIKSKSFTWNILVKGVDELTEIYSSNVCCERAFLIPPVIMALLDSASSVQLPVYITVYITASVRVDEWMDVRTIC